MLKYAIGTKIYYRGDQANHEGNFEITSATDDKWGRNYTMTEIQGEHSHNRIIRHINECMIDTKDTGNGSTRFCTQEAYEAHRAEQIKQMQEYMQNMKAKQEAKTA